MLFRSIMQDTNAWSPEQHAAAKQEFALYKEKLRPFIRDADLYHISDRPDGVHWDGIEYYNVHRGRAVVYAFRGWNPTEKQHVFPLRGFKPGSTYRVHFQDGSSANRTECRDQLLRNGLRVMLATPKIVLS